MATYIGYPSDLGQTLTNPSMQRPGRFNQHLAKGKENRPFSSTVKGTKEDGLFQDSLIVSGGKSRPRNPWAVFGSLAVQSLVLAALIVIPLYHTDPLPKRQVLTMLYAPPPAAGGSNVAKLRALAYTSSSATISLPNTVHKMRETPAPQDSTPGGVVGGVPGGVVGGIPGGILGGLLGGVHSVAVPVLAKASVPAPVKRVHVPSRIAEANLIHDVAPAYPAEAGRARIEGTVVLDAVIGKDGSIQDVRVESGLPVLAQAAIDAVKQWRYRPYLLNGEPIEVDSRITINFTLSKG